MPTELLTSKLYIPPLHPSFSPRLRPIQLLNEELHTKRKLTLVSALAGFRKTTLEVTWLKETDQPTSWLSLDKADNDLQRFLTYLAAVSQLVDEGIDAPILSALQSPHLSAIKKALTALLNEIALRIYAHILVLDDYHLLTEAAILEVMEFLLRPQHNQQWCSMSSSPKMEILECLTLPLSLLKSPQFVRN